MRVLVLGVCVILASCGGEPATGDDVAVSRYFDALDSLDEHYSSYQRAVADCMNDAGFDYSPVPYHDNRRESASPIRSIYLYVGPGEEATFGQVLQDARSRAASLADPNRAAIAAMSPSEQDSYYATLMGEMDDGTEHAPGGCSGLAAADVPFLRDTLHVHELTDTFIQQVTNHPTTSAALANWSGCIEATTGVAYAGPWAVRAELAHRSLDAVGAIVLDPGTSYEVALTAVIESPGVQQLLDEERSLASATLECQVVHLEPVRNVVIEMARDVYGEGLPVGTA